MKKSILRFLLDDNLSLEDYYRVYKLPDIKDIRRRLFLKYRDSNRNIPDHYYHKKTDYDLRGIESLEQLLTVGLDRLASHHLFLRDNRIYVKQEEQVQWQSLITFITPLTLQSAFLFKELKVLYTSDGNTVDCSSICTFYENFICPNFKFTALPHPFIPQVEHLVRKTGGFCDLHMHLNGSTETDKAWQHFLKNPDQVSQDLNKAFKGELVKEQLGQEVESLTPDDINNLLRVAQQLRLVLFDILTGKFCEKVEDNSSIAAFLRGMKEKETYADEVYHPFSQLLFNGSPKAVNSYAYLSLEALMLAVMFKYIANKERFARLVAHILHYYLLILGVVNRLLVQQVHQFGFTQFQKITLNDLRDDVEGTYADRFLQLHGNELRHIRYLEGRFSPKDSDKENEMLFHKIERGWKELCTRVQAVIVEKGVERKELEQPKLVLIAHFIKKVEKSPDHYVQFKELRLDLNTRANALVAFKKSSNCDLADRLVGIDAASSEFDTPPEVFSPIFRKLRRAGFNHFTYHAGEDFYHVVSGIRAIYEAIEFNEFQHGDRIGHATASGIDIAQWINNVGETIYIKRGEHLDNLTFLYSFIIEEKIESLKSLLPHIASHIAKLNQEVYNIKGGNIFDAGLNKDYTVNTIVQAWSIRKYCPILLQKMKALGDSDPSSMFASLRNEEVYDEDELQDICENVLRPMSHEPIELFFKYHSNAFRKRYDEIIPLTIGDIISIEQMTTLQKALLNYMHKKEIVIETLPTSNIRIGHHYDFDTYHLWNWINWKDEGVLVPPIVIGTDDAGIFATNIYNEYANIYCYLTSACRMNHTKALEVVEQLDKNAQIYKFV